LSQKAYVTQVFAPVLTFAIFSVIARRKGGGTTLDTARVFTSLSLFTLLADPLASLVMSLATFMGSVGSFTRIQEFLDKEERADCRKTPLDFDDDYTELATPSLNTAEKRSISTDRSSAPAPSLKSKSSFYVSRDAITIEDGSFGWDLDKEPLLKGITMSVPRHRFTVVVGPVGCGKSTLLKAILGEVPTLAGTVKLASTNIAYCDQTPWHMNGTIQQAIIGVSALDSKWYARVLEACALQEDLKQLPKGDQSTIGSQGIALSGGQSQRIVSSFDTRTLSTFNCSYYLRHWLELSTPRKKF
jgi:ATP-binding cassette, subfamily C (CFTR/MRP), member 1